MRSLLGNLLEILIPDVPDFVHCHVSLQGLGLNMTHAKAVADELIDYVGRDCTLIIPSFSFGPNTVYELFIAQDHIRYDVSNTPCRVNIFGEVFRRRTGVERSLNPILPLAFVGPRSSEIINEAHLDAMPFGPQSAYGKLAGLNTAVLGLGVNMNTNGFFHLLDDPFVDKLPMQVYSKMPKPCSVYDNGTLLLEGGYYYVIPALRKRISPIKLHKFLKEQSFYRYISMPHGYCLDVQKFVKFGVNVALQSIERGKLPPWHEEL